MYEGDTSLSVNHCYLSYNLMINILKTFFFFELILSRPFNIVLSIARCNQNLDLSPNMHF